MNTICPRCGEIMTYQEAESGWPEREVCGDETCDTAVLVEHTAPGVVKVKVDEWDLCERRRNFMGLPNDKYEAIASKIGTLVDEKQAAYGNSFGKAGDFLRILYPAGIKPEQYDDLLTLVRVFDKQMRIATHKDALGENPWQDIAGYAVLECGRNK